MREKSVVAQIIPNIYKYNIHYHDSVTSELLYSGTKASQNYYQCMFDNL